MKPVTILFGIAMLALGCGLGYAFAKGKQVAAAASLMKKLAGDAETVEVRVIAKKYVWLFHYPGPDGKFGASQIQLVSEQNPLGLLSEGGAGTDDFYAHELCLPQNAQVRMQSKSRDLIHSLGGLPEGTELDAIPGVNEEAAFRSSDEPGTALLRCIQLCGPGCKDHKASIRTVSENEFKTWCVEMSGKASPR